MVVVGGLLLMCVLHYLQPYLLLVRSTGLTNLVRGSGAGAKCRNKVWLKSNVFDKRK